MSTQSGSRRVVMVTGATGGIGQPLTTRLAERGFAVVAAARSVGTASVERDGRSLIVPLALDVTDDASIARAVETVSALVGSSGLAGLVNNAGIIVEGPLDLIPAEDLRYQFAVNVIGPFALTRALLPLLRAGRGRVVNIGAASAHTTVPFFGAVSASKAALASLSDAMRMEFAPFGVKVVLIEPGAIATDILGASASRQREAMKAATDEKVALYTPAIEAVRTAMKKSPIDRPDVVVEAIVDALTAARPKRRQLVGKGAAQLAFLRKLPIGLRDRILTGSLGISKALRGAASPVALSTSSDR